jgi:hypothetical protein
MKANPVNKTFALLPLNLFQIQQLFITQDADKSIRVHLIKEQGIDLEIKLINTGGEIIFKESLTNIESYVKKYKIENSSEKVYTIALVQDGYTLYEKQVVVK